MQCLPPNLSPLTSHFCPLTGVLKGPVFVLVGQLWPADVPLPTLQSLGSNCSLFILIPDQFSCQLEVARWGDLQFLLKKASLECQPSELCINSRRRWWWLWWWCGGDNQRERLPVFPHCDRQLHREMKEGEKQIPHSTLGISFICEGLKREISMGKCVCCLERDFESF